MTTPKTPQDQIRYAAKIYMAEHSGRGDYYFNEEDNEESFLAGASWMLEAVLRELRSEEARTMHMSQLKSAPIWPTDWARFIESRFKKLEEGETR